MLAGLAAACGSTRHATAPPAATTAAMRPPVPPVARKPVKLLVTVVDGDRRVRVPDARVSLWGRVALTDSTGIARMLIPWSRPLAVTVSAPGFGARTVLESFRKRQATIRIYRRDLQWPLYGATATRTQAQSHITLRPPFRTVWSVGLGGLIEFPAVVDDGVAYIGNRAGTIRAISMRFGRVAWRHDTPNGKMASSPAVVGDELVYHSMNGEVYVLDRSSGRERWSFSVGSPVESSPIVENGVDYFGAWDGRLYALDLRTHELRWSRDLGAKITSSAAISGGTLYIGDYAGRLWAISTRTGETRWVGAVNGRVYGTPSVSDGRVFVPSSTGNSLTAFTTAGQTLWRVGAGGYVYSSPAVSDGRVFFGSYDGVFTCVSAANGQVLWRVGAGGPISGAAVVVAGVAYAGSFAHRIVGVDVGSGRVVVQFGHGSYVPVSGNGMRLLFHGYSRLYAVEPRSVSKKTPRRRAVTRHSTDHKRPLRRPPK